MANDVINTLICHWCPRDWCPRLKRLISQIFFLLLNRHHILTICNLTHINFTQIRTPWNHPLKYSSLTTYQLIQPLNNLCIFLFICFTFLLKIIDVVLIIIMLHFYLFVFFFYFKDISFQVLVVLLMYFDVLLFFINY